MKSAVSDPSRERLCAYISLITATRQSIHTHRLHNQYMAPISPNLKPSRDESFAPEQLKAYDGSDPEKPVYVAIKGSFRFLALVMLAQTSALSGTVFDVSAKRDVYGPGKSYGIFAGKDASKALGLSSLKPADAVANYSDLTEDQMKVLDQWYDFFEYAVCLLSRHPSNTLYRTSGNGTP
jgi:membrane-associated progesterone receptor component